MLTGEHAVLYGHRAIACAIDQRLTVKLTPRDDAEIHVQSSLGSFTCTLDALPRVTAPGTLRFVVTAMQRYAYPQGFELDIQSDIDPTFGLGSSAAVTLATIDVCQRFTQSAEHVFDAALATVQHVQGRGSGTDLAASLTGGMIGYTMEQHNQATDLKRLDKPQTTLPCLSLHYSGYKTTTADVLAIVAEKMQAFPDLYSDIYQLMHNVSAQIETAIAQSDWQKMGTLMNVYQGLMDALGVNDATLSAIVYDLRARDDVLGAKISGSGLGDCVIALHKANNKNAMSISETGLTSEINE